MSVEQEFDYFENQFLNPEVAFRQIVAEQIKHTLSQQTECFHLRNARQKLLEKLDGCLKFLLLAGRKWFDDVASAAVIVVIWVRVVASQNIDILNDVGINSFADMYLWLLVNFGILGI